MEKYKMNYWKTFLSEFQLIILFTLNVYVYRKKKQPKVSPGLGENGVELLLTWNFDNNCQNDCFGRNLQ